MNDPSDREFSSLLKQSDGTTTVDADHMARSLLANHQAIVAGRRRALAAIATTMVAMVTVLAMTLRTSNHTSEPNDLITNSSIERLPAAQGIGSDQISSAATWNNARVSAPKGLSVTTTRRHPDRFIPSVPLHQPMMPESVADTISDLIDLEIQQEHQLLREQLSRNLQPPPTSIFRF